MKGRLVEAFLVASWTEHLRQHERVHKLTIVLVQEVRGPLRILAMRPKVTQVSSRRVLRPHCVSALLSPGRAALLQSPRQAARPTKSVNMDAEIGRVLRRCRQSPPTDRMCPIAHNRSRHCPQARSYAPKAAATAGCRASDMLANSCREHCAKLPLLNHLVGAGESSRRAREANPWLS